jgi:hypothetical protein
LFHGKGYWDWKSVIKKEERERDWGGESQF